MIKELEGLTARRLEIENNLEQYNNPATLAKYSKMQRELTKITKAIKTAQDSIQKES